MQHHNSPRRRHVRTAVATTVAALSAVAAGSVAWGIGGQSGDAPTGSARSASTKADFDKDGHEDLAVNAPDSGYVAVAYGSKNGTDPGHHQIIDAGSVGGGTVAGKGAAGKGAGGEPGQSFGERSIARDLDGDGYTDLAVTGDGGVFVLFGSKKGLGGGKKLADVPGDADVSQVTAGDFDGDGHTDLVLGAGKQKGLLKGPFTRDGKAAGLADVPGTDESGNPSDSSLALTAGDMNGDGSDDLVHFRTEEGKPKAPEYIAGGKEGFQDSDASVVPQGDTAAVADVDKDGIGDLIVHRVPADDQSNHQGPIEVLPGTEKGPDKSRPTTVEPDSPGVPGHLDKGNDWGSALRTGDVNGDGYGDVVVNAPGQTVQGKKNAGTLTLLKGGKDGLTTKGAQTVDESFGGKPEDVQENDLYGGSKGGEVDFPVRLLDANGDGKAELAAGTAQKNDGEGMARVLLGSGDGLSDKGARTLTPGDVGAKGGGFSAAFAQ